MSSAGGDHFSTSAGIYRRARPGYPAALYDCVLSRVDGRQRAWDCGAGSGQALGPLPGIFRQVIASDVSARQLAGITPRPGLLRVVADAARSPLPAASVDLVVVAQAWHWFAGAAFTAEVRRVLRPRGLFAAWTYDLCRVDPALDEVVDCLYDDVLAGWWPPERCLVERRYADLAAPYEGGETLRLTMACTWRCEQFLDYLSSWSAVARRSAAGHGDAIAELRPALQAAWGRAEDLRTVCWPLTLRLCAAPG